VRIKWLWIERKYLPFLFHLILIAFPYATGLCYDVLIVYALLLITILEDTEVYYETTSESLDYCMEGSFNLIDSLLSVSPDVFCKSASGRET